MLGHVNKIMYVLQRNEIVSLYGPCIIATGNLLAESLRKLSEKYQLIGF